MNYITDALVIVGGTFLTGIIRDAALHIRTRESKPLYHDNSYRFQLFNNTSCPKCNTNWKFENIKYCSCEEYHDGHFHMACEGMLMDGKIIKIPNYGCNFKWIMRTKT